LKKFPDVKDIRPDDTDWTGSEIRTACEIADSLNCTPKESAQWIVPVCKMAAEQIESLRKQANGRYLSANKPGVYKTRTVETPMNSARKMESI
jgi:hypothetical protein